MPPCVVIWYLRLQLPKETQLKIYICLCCAHIGLEKYMHFKKHSKTEAPKKIDSSTTLKWTTNGLLLPHEIFGSLYHHQDGHLFFSLLVGLPGATWWHHALAKNVTVDITRTYMDVHACPILRYSRSIGLRIANWKPTCGHIGNSRCLYTLESHSCLWENICKLCQAYVTAWFRAQDLDAPATMSYVIPVRLYGDGADAFSPKPNTCMSNLFEN